MLIVKKKISGFQLKQIAFISMIIDHFAVIFLYRYLYEGNSYLNFLYYIFRAIGRISFPVFSFLLVEGSIQTSNRRRYLIRLLLFALISEIPYDWGTTGIWINFNYQNIFFLFFLGLLVICLFEELQKIFPVTICFLLKFMFALGSMFLAECIRVDYGYVGILIILLMYLLNNKNLSIIFSCLILTWLLKFEVFLFLAVIPILLYDGKRGKYNKYLFYVAYSVQFLVLRVLYSIILLFW
ncbi:MAG: conjugal transfer protein TraX [Lachnospiraceae bacterium]|nr:conjugal transfer protein TraX [Lachnospiraceae bacterium]